MWFLDFLFPPRVDERLVREIDTDAFCSLLAPRPVEKTHPLTVALLPFSDALVRAAIHEAKYHGNQDAFSLLSSVLLDYLGDSDERLYQAIIVPVPLSAKRMRERGFNQVEEIVERISPILDIPLQPKLLVRTRDTASQVLLSHTERAENMRDAFRAAPLDPSFTYIVIDDVVTTGATLQAAIDALSVRGAKYIPPLALAH